MGIHYDYKSTRGEKAMKKEAKRMSRSKNQETENKMHDIQKPITLDDLTNPDKN